MDFHKYQSGRTGIGAPDFANQDWRAGDAARQHEENQARQKSINNTSNSSISGLSAGELLASIFSSILTIAAVISFVIGCIYGIVVLIEQFPQIDNYLNEKLGKGTEIENIIAISILGLFVILLTVIGFLLRRYLRFVFVASFILAIVLVSYRLFYENKTNTATIEINSMIRLVAVEQVTWLPIN